MVLPFAGGVSPPLPVVSLLFSVSYPQPSRSYYLFFNYLFFTICVVYLFDRISRRGVYLFDRISRRGVYLFDRGKLSSITGTCG